MAVGDINLIGYRPRVIVVETKHTDIYLDCRIIIEEHRQTGGDTDIELEIALVGTRELVARAVTQFRLSTAQLHLYLGKETEACASPETDIIAKKGRTEIVLTDTIQVVDVIVCLAIEYYVGRIEPHTLAAVRKAATGCKVVLEAEHHSRAKLEGIRIAIDFFKYKELIIILVRL